MAKTGEPFWWLLFAAGGTVSAFLVPVHLLLGLALAAGAGGTREAFAYDRVLTVASHPLARIYLFVLISLSLFHWAHRFRFTLADGLHLKSSSFLSWACYGSAILGTLLTIVTLARL